MKRFLVLFALVLCIAGCEKGDEFGDAIPVSGEDFVVRDWAPIEFYVKVLDSDGKDLLDPSNDNSWVIGTVLDFKGKKSIVGKACLDTVYKSKAYMPQYYGVRLFKIEYDSLGYFLKLGEFDGADKYDNEKLTITWPDGKSNIVTYSRKFNESHTGLEEEIFKLDGTKCLNPITIVR